MGRAFTVEEKAAIRKRIIDAGIVLFGQYGLKKTSIEDIAHRARIAKGTFYLFFESKESLFFDVFSTYEDQIQKPLLERLASLQPLTRSGFSDFLFQTVSLFQKDPLLRRLMSGEDFNLLWRRLTQEEIEALSQQDIEALGPLIVGWQEKGEMVNEDVHIIVQMIRCFYVLTLHETELGKEHFMQTLQLMAQAIADRLVIHD